MSFRILALALTSLWLIAWTIGTTEAKSDEKKPPATPDKVAAVKLPVDAADKVKSDDEAPPSKEPTGLPWQSNLRRAYVGSLREAKPVLVRVGAPWCGYCVKMAEEIEDAKAQDALGRWTLVYLDADQATAETTALGVGPIPALRILTSDGRLIASRDGYMPVADFVSWLDENYEAATAKPIDELLDGSELGAVAVVRLVRELGQRDAVLREAAIRRLHEAPEIAAAPIIGSFAEGSLQTRLAALEVLKEWQAPIGEIDPWRPESVTQQRLKTLVDWSKQAAKSATAEKRELTTNERNEAEQEIDRLFAAEDKDAPAIRERLARFGAGLLPMVYERLKEARRDVERQRLTALRYRLVASNRLVLGWRGGLDRLATTDVEARRQAADELAQRVTAADEAILLELFSDPDPLVREIALRGLYDLGRSAAPTALVKLLSDPEPNVRAAVLKLFAERPSAKLVPSLAEYIAKEKDPDLVVHAVRVLREVQGNEARAALISLFKNESWRVRAEAAEAIGKQAEKNRGLSNSEAEAESYAALIELLNDSDGFVVGKALGGMKYADLEIAVEPMIKAAEKHPELAGEVVKRLSSGSKMRTKALPHLRRFCLSPVASLRAEAIRGVCKIETKEIVADDLTRSFADSENIVRIAAAESLLELLEAKRQPHATDEAAMNASQSGPRTVVMLDPKQAAPEPPSSIGLSIIRSLFGNVAPASDVKNAPKEAEMTKAAAKPATKEADAKQPHSVAKKEKSADTEAPVMGNSRYEAWLAAFKGGKDRPKWMGTMRPSLKTMLTADSVDERLAGALTLLAMGDDSLAMPVVDAAAKLGPDQTIEASKALRWLPWPERIALFNRLIASYPASTNFASVVTNMRAAPDQRILERLWELLGAEKLDPKNAAALASALLEGYLGNRYYDPNSLPASQRERLTPIFRKRAEAGSEWQRLIALSLLLSVSPNDAGTAAETIVTDVKASAALKQDAFRIRLLSSSNFQGRKFSVEALNKGDEQFKDQALNYLAWGADDLRYLRDAIYLYSRTQESSVSSSEQTGIPDPPKGLEANALLPLLASNDPKAAALAGYFLVLLDKPEGLDPLLRYWRTLPATDRKFGRLVAEAIAYSANDDRHVAVLEEIYQRFEPKDYEIRKFYWTIRIMDGPRAKKLRSRIREEAGMDFLR